MNPSSEALRTLTIKKTFSAPIQLVWEAWSKPEHIPQWWGPKGMRIKVVAHDFWEGGQWKYIMVMPDGREFTSEGTYTEIDKPNKIITSADFKPMTAGVILQALFEENGEHTNFTFNVIHPSEEYKKQQEEMGFYNGWGSVFDRLEAFLSEKS